MLHCLTRSASLDSLEVPVVRALDEAKRGIGSVRLSDTDPCLLLGEGTKFTQQLKPRWQVVLPKSLGSYSALVDEVLSDKEVRLKCEFAFEGNGTAQFRSEVLKLKAAGKAGVDGWKAVPYFNQQETYKHVYHSLQQDGVIGILAEGAASFRLVPPSVQLKSLQALATTKQTSCLSNLAHPSLPWGL